MSAELLIKALLLLCLAVNTYRGMTSPTRTPRMDEQKRASIPDFLAHMPELQKFGIWTTKVRRTRPLNYPLPSTDCSLYIDIVNARPHSVLSL